MGTAPSASIQPTAALAATPVSAWLKPRSDAAPPARSPKGAIATAETFDAMRPRLATTKKSDANTAAKPPRPVSAQVMSTAAAAARMPTPQPSTLRGPRPCTSLRFSCDTMMKPNAFTPK
jgi:hypothetical protein